MCQDYSKLKPVEGEKRYAEWDDEFQCHAVFGEQSGFCYGQYAEKHEADGATG